MAADKPNLNLCKTAMSAVALGYPMPTLLNWHGEFNRPSWHFSGTHIAKLESLLSVIDSLLNEDGGDASEDDLVLLVDAYDIWFQLPPSVLIARYHQLNREADARNAALWASLNIPATFPISPPRQDIIITSAKDCFPDINSGSNPHYSHWPPSPMPTNLYGAKTDQVLWTLDPARKYRKIRPRCVNSGMIMGSMGALRQALRRSMEKVDKAVMNGRQLWSDQALIGEVMGEQELWREWVRGVATTWDGSIAQNKPILHKPMRDIAEAALRGRQFDFGIGLDYNFTTIPATCSSEEDGYFVRLNDESSIRSESIKAGVSDGVRVQGIPPELPSYVDPDDLLTSTDWANQSLYTDFHFGVTPVGIHHNAYVDGLKPLRLKQWWDKLWFYPQLRTLVIGRLPGREMVKPLGRVVSEDGEREVEYYAPREDQAQKKVRVFNGEDDKTETIEWDGVCQENGAKRWWDEIFGDGIGPLYD